MVKEEDRARSSQEPLGDDEVPDWYPDEGLGEISLPTALQELVEAEAVGGSSLPQTLPQGGRRKSVWRPDAVREDRKMKAKLEWAKVKEKKRRRGGGVRKHKTHWQRVNAVKAKQFKYYHQTIAGGDAWKKYRYIWQVNGIKDISITPEEFNKIVEEAGGLLKIRYVRCWNRIVSGDTLMLVGYKGEILYRGTLVPDGYKEAKPRKEAKSSESPKETVG